MQAAYECPDSQIYMVGHSTGTLYHNIIRLLFESPQLAIFKPFCTWHAHKSTLTFYDKKIVGLGAKDAGALGNFQGKTFSLGYFDEMTLYPPSIIDMIDTRLSLPYSMGFASMNPKNPSHKLKAWIDKAEAGDPNYYALHFTLDDNPYLPQDYKDRIKNSLSGVFYKRHYLGLWCLAEGAIFDFLEHGVHIIDVPPRAAEYYIAGIDYGTKNAFACTLIGVSTGSYTQSGPMCWVEDEYYWDSEKMQRQKTDSEYIEDIDHFLCDYAPTSVYVDPTAASFKLELQRKGYHVVNAENELYDGIHYMSSKIKEGSLFICSRCVNLIKEMEMYVWDEKAIERGIEKPVKQHDHAIDSLRYACYTHKINEPLQTTHNPSQYLQNRFESRTFFH